MSIRSHFEMVRHLVHSHARWWGLDGVIELVHGPDDNWILSAGLGAKSISMPRQPQTLVPEALEMVALPCGGASVDLPFPTPGPNDLATIAEQGRLHRFLSVDLLTFLCGQLWRAEELLPGMQESAANAEHAGFLGDRYAFFDRPVVDLWMRSLFEQLLGRTLEPASPPHYWMSHDVDCLRKWKRLGVLKHIARFPLDLVTGKALRWARLMREALLAHFPERDPWYTVPAMLADGVPATYFWLGHLRDQLAFRYDVRRPEYACLVKACIAQGHQVGLHGSPLHADDRAMLQQEKSALEALTAAPVLLHRQHYLRLVPSLTFRHLESLGMWLDSSMAFNARTGFRCGSCIPIPWWDLETGEALRLVELPLVAGDWTLHDPLRFNAQESLARIMALAEQVRLGGGILTLDFHELFFSADYPGHADFYRAMLAKLHAEAWQSWLPTLGELP